MYSCMLLKWTLPAIIYCVFFLSFLFVGLRHARIAGLVLYRALCVGNPYQHAWDYILESWGLLGFFDGSKLIKVLLLLMKIPPQILYVLISWAICLIHYFGVSYFVSSLCLPPASRFHWFYFVEHICCGHIFMYHVTIRIWFVFFLVQSPMFLWQKL